MRITLRGILERRAVAGFGRAAPTGLLASSDTAGADAIAGSGILSAFNVRAGSGADRGSDGCCGTGPKGSVGGSSTSGTGSGVSGTGGLAGDAENCSLAAAGFEIRRTGGLALSGGDSFAGIWSGAASLVFA